MYHAVALAASLYWLGSFLCEKVPLFGRYCIPAPLVGGVCFAAVNTALYATGTAFISFDDTLQVVFMNIFTTVGFTVSLQQLKRGGKAVFLCLILAIIITCGQNLLGVLAVGALGADPRLGLCAGSIAMIDDRRPRHRRGLRAGHGGDGDRGRFGRGARLRDLRPRRGLGDGRADGDAQD